MMRVYDTCRCEVPKRTGCRAAASESKRYFPLTFMVIIRTYIFAWCTFMVTIHIYGDHPYIYGDHPYLYALIICIVYFCIHGESGDRANLILMTLTFKKSKSQFINDLCNFMVTILIHSDHSD
jgi:hypothetical protein